MADKLHNHFWFDLNKGQSIDASEGSSYHIQHAVRNPQKFGFKDAEEMQQHASRPVKDKSGQDIDSGYYDIDYDLEHNIMGKGFVRGYHTPAGMYDGHISFDASDDKHAAKALQAFLPHVEKAEANGKRYDIDMSVGHRAKSPKYKSFTSSDQIKQHIGKLAPKGLEKKEPQTFQGVGQVTEPVRKKIKDALKKKDPSAPNWKLEQDVGYSTGTWGDSVEYRKTYKEFFKEMLGEVAAPSSAQSQLRRAGTSAQQARLKRAGGQSAVTGAVAAKAGLKGSQLSSLEKTAGKGKRIPPAMAQKLAQAALKQK